MQPNNLEDASRLRQDGRPTTDDDAIRALISRLARRHSSGGEVIERAAIMAAGVDSTAMLAWIEAHDGQAEVPTVAKRGAHGLHGGRLSGGGDTARPSAPRRYVLPPGALS